jgi:DNA-binding ferritin-like protein
MKKFSDFSRKKINEQEDNVFSRGEVAIRVNPNTSGNVLSELSGEGSDNISNETPEVTKSEPAKFISKLLESREMAQVYHWTVKGDPGSHAAHTALNEYYDSVINHIDDLVECYQGQYELIEEYDVIDTKETKTKEKIEYFQEVVQFIKDTRYTAILEEDTHLQNIIDEVVALIYKLLYKLKYNK